MNGDALLDEGIAHALDDLPQPFHFFFHASGILVPYEWGKAANLHSFDADSGTGGQMEHMLGPGNGGDVSLDLPRKVGTGQAAPNGHGALTEPFMPNDGFGILEKFLQKIKSRKLIEEKP